MTLPTPWRVERQRYLVEDDWLVLRADDCRTTDGHAIAPYYVFEYRDWTAVVALTGAGEIILVREYRHGAGAVMLGLPGGVQDVGDRDPTSAALRELEEETGYRVLGFHPLAPVWANPATHTNAVHGVLAWGAVPTGTRQLHAAEAIEVVLLPVADCVVGVLDGTLRLSGAHASIVLAAASRIARAQIPVLAELRSAVRTALAG